MFEFRQTNQFAEVISLILGIVDNYLDSKMKDAVDLDIHLQKNKLRKEAQAENQEFLNHVDSTMKTIINEQTSYTIAASLSEFGLKILIDKMEENKSINRSNIQKNLYNAFVKSYNSDKDIIISYDDVVTSKRERDDQDKDGDPSVGSNRGSKRRISGKEAESSKELTHTESKSISSSKVTSRSQPKSSGKSAQVEEHGQTVDDLEEQTHHEFNTRNDVVTHFSDGTLNHFRTALNDISTRIEMDYLPKRKWSKQDKQRARMMINAINKKLRGRRLMRNLEKFIGGKPYWGDLWLLEKTI
nr:hypothetical protein [Tanacetum cinerariifolium]